MPQERPFKILGIDHFAIAVKDIETWKRFYLNIPGAELFSETPDVNRKGRSSMHLCGIRIGGMSIALVQGIDREEKSQVTEFVKKHGDHSFQHIAIAVDDLRALVAWGKERGWRFNGSIKQRRDNFGAIRQIFAKKFDPDLCAVEASFYEFVERPQEGETFKAADSFSDDFAQDLYEDVEEAGEETFVDLS